MTQPTWPEIKGRKQSPKDSELSNWRGGEGGTASLSNRRRQHSLLGTVKPTWCCHGMEGTSDTWTKPAPPFTAPVSSVSYHFSTSPSSLTPSRHHPHPTPSWLTATYITLTNQRLWGFFFCRTFTTDIYFSKSTIPFSNVICLEKKKQQSNIRSPLCFSITCCLFKSFSVSVQFFSCCISDLLHPLYHHPLYLFSSHPLHYSVWLHSS